MTEKNAQSVYHFTYADAVSKALHQHHRNAQPRRKKDVKLVFSIREKRPVVSQKQTFQQVKQKAQPQTEKGTAVVDLDAKVPNLDDIYQELVSRKGTEVLDGINYEEWPWILKGVSATLKRGGYTLSCPRRHSVGYS